MSPRGHGRVSFRVLDEQLDLTYRSVVTVAVGYTVSAGSHVLSRDTRISPVSRIGRREFQSTLKRNLLSDTYPSQKLAPRPRPLKDYAFAVFVSFPFLVGKRSVRRPVYVRPRDTRTRTALVEERSDGPRSRGTLGFERPKS